VRSGDRLVDVVVGIVDVDDVDPVDPQALEAGVEGGADRVVREVESGLELAKPVRVQQAADLGRQHDPLARSTEGRAEPALGLAQPVEGRRVEERHPSGDGAAGGGHGGRLGVAPERRGQRRGAQAEAARPQPRSPQDDLIHGLVRHTLPLGRRDK
jgi:hypothetical protein